MTATTTDVATTVPELAPATRAAILTGALNRFTEDVYVSEAGPHLTCGELDALATMLAVLGKEDAAAYWLVAHAHHDEGEAGDDDATDYEDHLRIRDADDPGIGSEAGLEAAHTYIRDCLLGPIAD